MFYALMGRVHAAVHHRLEGIRRALEGERGQGTVEYVGLILLVSLLMVGMVAAMKGFNKSLIKGATPRELSEAFVDGVGVAENEVLVGPVAGPLMVAVTLAHAPASWSPLTALATLRYRRS
jgi:hypothetical protein